MLIRKTEKQKLDSTNFLIFDTFDGHLVGVVWKLYIDGQHQNNAIIWGPFGLNWLFINYIFKLRVWFELCSKTHELASNQNPGINLEPFLVFAALMVRWYAFIGLFYEHDRTCCIIPSILTCGRLNVLSSHFLWATDLEDCLQNVYLVPSTRRIHSHKWEFIQTLTSRVG